MSSRAATITLPAREISIHSEFDVLVCGAGMAGIGAAVAAAREGARVLLVEQIGFLGGTMTAVTLGSICGEFALEDGQPRRVVGGLAADLTRRLIEAGGATEPFCWLNTATTPYDPFQMRCTLDSLVAEAGVHLLLHAHLADVIEEDGVLSTVVLQAREGPLAVRVRAVVDCSGDAEVAAMAGAPWEMDTSELQMPSAMFRFGGVAPDALENLDRPMLRDRLEAAVADGFELPRTAGGLFSIRPGVVHANVTRADVGGRSPNPLSSADMTRAEIEGRRQVKLYEQAFRAFVPGFENAYILEAGARLGIRESRRVLGQHVLEGDDVLGARRFDDAIACSAWPIEEHGADKQTRWVWLEPGAYYQIPLRCLVPSDGPRNLLVAGRCASATHDAHASMRVGATCMAMGEAAGIAAALCRNEAGDDVSKVPASDVQDRLRAHGAFLG